MYKMFLNNLIVIFLILIILNNCNAISEDDYKLCLISKVTKTHHDFTIETSAGKLYNKLEYIQIKADQPDQFNYYDKECLCKDKLCVRKCCANDQIHIRQNKRLGCHQPENDSLTKLDLDFYNLTIEVKNSVKSSVVRLIDGDPCALGKRYTLYKDEDLYHLQHNTGMLYNFENRTGTSGENEGKYEHKTWNEYCIENQLTDDGKTNTQYFICDQIKPDDPSSVRKTKLVKIGACGLIISIPFLFLTFLVYAIIPELQNLHGKSLMCYVFTLMFAYTLLAFIQLRPTQPSPICEIIAFSVYYSFLVSFFWLNVMCFDIWWTFSGISGFKSSFRNSEQKKFFFYHLYAWGVPTTILMISLIMQFHPSVQNSWYKPRLGMDSMCWFHDKKTTMLYFHLPLFFVITTNVCLFLSTAIKIIKIRRDTAMLSKTNESKRHESSNYSKDKQRFVLYLKLFIVMGVNWTMELISIFFENKSSNIYAWIFTDFGNTLHGVLIFIIFVCKRQIWALLVKRYHVIMGRPYQANAAFSRTQTTSYSVSQSTDTTFTQHGGSVKLNNFN